MAKGDKKKSSGGGGKREKSEEEGWFRGKSNRWVCRKTGGGFFISRPPLEGRCVGGARWRGREQKDGSFVARATDGYAVKQGEGFSFRIHH